MSGKNWVTEAASDWTKYTGGYANFGYLGRHLGPVVDAEGWDTVRPAWQRFLRETESRFVSAPYFARSFGQWADKPNGRVSQERAREMFRAAGLEPPRLMPEYFMPGAVEKIIERELRKAS